MKTIRILQIRTHYLVNFFNLKIFIIYFLGDFTTTLTNVTPSNPSESSTNNMSRRRKRRKSKSQNEKVPFNSFGDPELDNLIKRKYIELINSNDYGINTSNKKRSRNFSRKKKASKVIKVGFIIFLNIINS